MRALVFFLGVANLLFLAWTRGYFGDEASTSAGQMQRRQLMAERVNIIARDESSAAPTAKAPEKQNEPVAPEMPADRASPVQGDQPARETPQSTDRRAEENAPAKPAPEKTEPGKTEKPVSMVCLTLNDLNADELARVTEITGGRFRDFRVDRRSSAGSRSYWVFIPPLGSRQAADRQSEALKRAGAPEFFIVQEPPAMRFAISLGVFSTREAAEERRTDLRLKGIDAARVGERETRSATYQLELRGPEPRAGALRQAIAGALPKARLASCKAK